MSSFAHRVPLGLFLLCARAASVGAEPGYTARDKHSVSAIGRRVLLTICGIGYKIVPCMTFSSREH